MPRQSRGEYLNPSEVQVVHAVQRCVRRAYLCGQDEHSGQSFEHRREWIRERLELLASVFANDCLTYTVLSNHLHVVLRTRPDRRFESGSGGDCEDPANSPGHMIASRT